MKLFYCFILTLLLTACNSTFDRLKKVGQTPELDDVKVPEYNVNFPPQLDYSQNYIQNNPHVKKGSNSLWQPGARAFFRDQRARSVGDILKVAVKIKNNASLDNQSEQIRTGKETMGIPSLFGVEKKVANLLSKNGNQDSLINHNLNKDHLGRGNISRKEEITTEVAAMVTQILPNGNLVITGKQEIRVNHELREVTVAGIVRPEDISAENSVASDQIAEARISYGGRGSISDMQQPRIGTQIVDAISPF